MTSYILDKHAVEVFIKEHKLQPFKMKQIFHELFKNQNYDFAEMTTLSKDLRTDLAESFHVLSLQVEKIIEE